MATPSQVGRIVFATVLFRNDVFQMKCVWLVIFMDLAILASAACPLPDQSPRCNIH